MDSFLGTGYEGPARPTILSIPLNGFPMLPDPGPGRGGRSMLSIPLNGFLLSAGGDGGIPAGCLSIPLNGFRM